MHFAKIGAHDRSRELRRRLILPARLRTGQEWSETCILNMSSRGLLINTARSAPKGSLVRLQSGEHVINARVVWRNGARVGLRTEDRLPVEEIMSSSKSIDFQLVASHSGLINSGKQLRGARDESRLRGRAIEFIAVTIIALTLAICIWAMVRHALAPPVTKLEAALDGHL